MPKGEPTCRVGSPRCRLPALHAGPLIISFYWFIFPLFCYNFSYFLLFHSKNSTAVADVWGWQPEMQKKCISGSDSQMSASNYVPSSIVYYHVLSRTTTYCYVLPRTTTDYHVLPRTTKYYHILPHTTKYYTRYYTRGPTPHTTRYCYKQNVIFASLAASLYCRGRCLRLAARDANTFLHRRHRPQRFSHLGQPTANICQKAICISGSQAQTSATKFYASRAASCKHRPRSLHVLRSFLHVGRTDPPHGNWLAVGRGRRGLVLY